MHLAGIREPFLAEQECFHMKIEKRGCKQNRNRMQPMQSSSVKSTERKGYTGH